jgi:hypothetical protein
MPFSESLKLEVRRKAHFCCCLCHALEVEIHHIIPESEGGADIQDNAAPLCPSCHETYGNNPSKRKFIREARDFWYELCEERFTSGAASLQEIADRVDQTASKKDLQEAFKELIERFGVGGASAEVVVSKVITADQMLGIELPETYWIVILAALQSAVDRGFARMLELREQGFTPKEAMELPPEQITAMAGPLIARCIIVDALSEKGIMTKEAAQRLGTEALQRQLEAVLDSSGNLRDFSE